MLNFKNFLSIANTAQKIKELALHFPMVVADFILGTGIALYLLDHGDNEFLGKILITAIIGFFMFLAGYMFAERNRKGKLISSAAVVAILSAYYFYLPKSFDNFTEIHAIRSFLLAFVSILAIMTAPYLKKGGTVGFWQYNKKLFLRFAFTGISSVTLFLGIAASLASFDFLFNANINDEWYARVWILVVGLVATTIFTVGVPRDFDRLELETDYPKVIKIFTQFILLPLIGLYAVILYLYGGKIIFTGEWPKGLVSYLILVFSSVGVIANLLLYLEREKALWVRNLAKVFWAMLIPLMILLYSAVYIRISDYGLTHDRLFVVILGLWLLGLSAYFLFGKRYDIKMVFVSLAVVILVFAFAPVNVFSVSSSSQIKRLEKILVADKILVGGKIKKIDAETISQKDARQISSIVDYLGKTGRTDKLQKWFEQDLKNISDNQYGSSREIMKLMGLEYGSEYVSDVLPSSDRPRFYYVEDENNFDISGFKYLYDFDLFISQGETKSIPDSFSVDSTARYLLELDQKNKIYIKEKSSVNDVFGKELAAVGLDQFVQNLAKNFDISNSHNLPREKMTVEINSEKKTAKIYFTSLTLEQKDDHWTITEAKGLLLYN